MRRGGGGLRCGRGVSTPAPHWWRELYRRADLTLHRERERERERDGPGARARRTIRKLIRYAHKTNIIKPQLNNAETRKKMPLKCRPNKSILDFKALKRMI